MSFGFGVGDFLAVGTLCWKIYKKCKESTGNYAELSSEVISLHGVIKETEELLSEQQDLNTQQKAKLLQCQKGCKNVLDDLNKLLVRYESLGTNSQRTFDRMGYGMQDMNSIRLRLISNVSMLDAFNNTSFHSRLEKKLNLLIQEVRAGKREGSIISVDIFQNTQEDQHTWNLLRRELEDIGISTDIITEKRQYIIRWFQEAVAAGRLDETPPSDDDSGISIDSAYSSDSSAGENDDLKTRNRLFKRGEAAGSISRKPPTSSRKAIPAVPAKKDTNSRLLFNIFKEMTSPRKGEQFVEAARRCDIVKVKALLDHGVDINFRRRGSRETALHLAALYGDEDLIRFLLDKGANVNAKDNDGDRPLHCAIRQSSLSIARLLVEGGADVNAYNYDWDSPKTALTLAILISDIEHAELLLANGARVDGNDRKDFPLIEAAKHNRRDFVRLVLEWGADRESRDRSGKRAIDYCHFSQKYRSQEWQKDILNLLS